jgi:hypothetical protein
MLGFLWLAGAASSLPVVPAPPDTNPTALILEGRCTYPLNIGPPRLGETRILCDSVAVRNDGAAVTVEFSRENSARWFRFGGEKAGDRIAVTAVSSSWGTSSSARGTCRIFYKNERPSAVSCVAQAGGRSFVANLVPPTLPS